MKEIQTEIQIAASKDQVWEILMDLPNWSIWNPTVNKIDGNLKEGSELSITISDSKGNDSKKYKAEITAIEENKRFSFFATMMAKFMFSAHRIIEIEDSEEGVILSQKEVYTGIMVSLFWSKLSTDALEMLNSMNKALKKEVEK